MPCRACVRWHAHILAALCIIMQYLVVHGILVDVHAASASGLQIVEVAARHGLGARWAADGGMNKPVGGCSTLVRQHVVEPGGLPAARQAGWILEAPAEPPQGPEGPQDSSPCTMEPLGKLLLAQIETKKGCQLYFRILRFG